MIDFKKVTRKEKIVINDGNVLEKIRIGNSELKSK